MTFSCRYFADGSQYGQYDFARFMLDAFDDGYVTGAGNGLKCSSDGTDMRIAVATGRGYIHGYSFDVSDNPEYVTLPTADATYDRIDRVVARLSPDTNKNITLTYVQGTPASSPVAPALTRTEATWEISLARVRVPHGSSFIPSANVYDDRDDRTVCGRANEKLISGDRITTGTVAGDRVQKATTTNYGVVKVGYGLEIHDGFLRVTGGELKGTFAKSSSTNGPSVALAGCPEVKVNFTDNSSGGGSGARTIDCTFTVSKEHTLPYMLSEQVTVGANVYSESSHEGTSSGCSGTITFKKNGTVISSYDFDPSKAESHLFTITDTTENLAGSTFTLTGTLTPTSWYWGGSVTDKSKGWKYSYLNFTA